MIYKIGADPELFLQNDQGKFISAIGKFGGTKEKPKQIPTFKPGFAVQEDNVAVEFNIPPVGLYLSGHTFFSRYINQAKQFIEAEAGAQGLRVAIVASAEFARDQLKHPRAKVFGCDPDFNVWSLKQNPKPFTENKALRSAGGHIHIGGQVEDKIGLGRALDLFVGCPSILFDPDNRRRLLYGKAGAIRDKAYGIEYRTLSNFWVKDAGLTEMVYNQCLQAVSFYDNQVIPDEDGLKIIACINESNKDLLKELTAKYHLRY